MPNGVAGGMMQPGGAPQRPPMQPGNPNINLVTALTQPGPNKVHMGIQLKVLKYYSYM